MALFVSGRSQCPICGRVLTEDDELFGTWGTFGVSLELFPFCDATMHWSCYAAWPHRREFARAYFDSWVDNERHNPYWAKAYLDDRVLVTVNPFRGEAELVLAATGSRVRVKMADWERWLDAPETSEGERLHPLDVEELRQASPALKAAIPTVAAVMDALDGESKGWTRRESRKGWTRRGSRDV